MEYKDYYKTLGVARDATQAEIKRAYRKLARQYHPDVSQETDAEVKFKEINEANAVLHDPEKRAAYDALGSNWHAGQNFRSSPGETHQNVHFSAEDMAEFSEFFSSLFGREFRADEQGRQRRRGQDQTVRLPIDLEEAYRGGTRQIRLDVPELGADGRPRMRTKTLNVRIPAGVTHGRQIRLSGQGAPGANGGPEGDLYLEIEINPHRLYSVEGKDIQLKLPIAPWEAALGASVSVPTLGGTVNLKVPPGSHSGQRLRLKGRGLPGEPPGDAIVVLEIVTPLATTDDAKAAYREMAERLHFNPRAEMGV